MGRGKATKPNQPRMLMAQCPKCGALPGKQCKYKSEEEERHYAERFAAARQLAEWKEPELIHG